MTGELSKAPKRWWGNFICASKMASRLVPSDVSFGDIRHHSVSSCQVSRECSKLWSVWWDWAQNGLSYRPKLINGMSHWSDESLSKDRPSYMTPWKMTVVTTTSAYAAVPWVVRSSEKPEKNPGENASPLRHMGVLSTWRGEVGAPRNRAHCWLGRHGNRPYCCDGDAFFRLSS